MKTILVSSALLLGGLCISYAVWQLFGSSHRKQAEMDYLSTSEVGQNRVKEQIWDRMWKERTSDRNKTCLGSLFTLPRKFYDSSYRQTLLHRQWKANSGGVTNKKTPGEGAEKGAGRDFDGMREKRASSIVTYFCIFVLVLSLIRAALDMNSNLKKSREENANQTVNLDSRRCSLNDFKLAQAHLKKREQTQRKAYLLRRAMTIMESPLAAQQQKEQPISQSLTNLSGKRDSVGMLGSKERLEKQQPSISETSVTSVTDSPSKIRPRFTSSVSPTPIPAQLRRMSFPAFRRGSSIDADVDDLIANHSPEVKRRMRLLRH